jgi:hypothetical protein
MGTIETDSRDTLSDGHRDFMIRYIEYELQRQERVSKQFLRGRVRDERAGIEVRNDVVKSERDIIRLIVRGLPSL